VAPATLLSPPGAAPPAPAPPPPPPPRLAPPEPRIEVAPYSYAAALALERELGVSHALGQVLVRRGLADPDAAWSWLRGAEAHPPSAFAGMEEACALVLGHVAARTRVTVHGDYDVDGVCSTALLVRTLRALGAEVDWFLPSRGEDGYGLSVATVRRLAARGTRLLLTVDCGVTAVEEIAAARAAGLDVLVTDHHAPRADGVLPDALLVHPSLCGYPCADLCATGVAHKLAEALLTASGADPAGAEEDLDLVALATLADVVPLRGENRRLVRAGLRALSLTAKPGLRALMRVARLDPSGLDAGAVSFRLAPRINAAGRLYRADAGVELLLTSDERRAEEIAAELDAANGERRARERRILWEAEAAVAELGARPAYVLAAEGWHPGVIGIVASRIAERHHRPTIMIALDGERPASGSGRSIPGFDLLEALHAAAPELERYGGHRAAAGLTVAPERLEALQRAVEHHAAATLTPDLLLPRRRVDAVVAGPALGLALAEELATLEPCGMGNPGPSLLVPGATLADPRPMGEGRHLRASLQAGGARSRVVAFGRDRLPAPPGEPLDALVRLECNEWNGAQEPRLVLRDTRPCAHAAIETLAEPASGAEWLAAALSAAGEEQAAPAPRPSESDRVVVDRRAEGAAGVLADLGASGEPTLALCADVPRRRSGLAARVGGFALASWTALERDPSLARPYVHVVGIDPPTDEHRETLARAGAPGEFLHLAWAEAELRFAARVHELEWSLRASLVALYRALRARGRVEGGELGAVLHGDGAHQLPAAVAGRLVRVLAELDLASLDPSIPALSLTGSGRTALERSPTFRAAAQRLEQGRRHLAALGAAAGRPAP